MKVADSEFEILQPKDEKVSGMSDRYSCGTIQSEIHETRRVYT